MTIYVHLVCCLCMNQKWEVYPASGTGEKNMENLNIPKNYQSALSLHDTQIGIKTVKDFFQTLLAER